MFLSDYSSIFNLCNFSCYAAFYFLVEFIGDCIAVCLFYLVYIIARLFFFPNFVFKYMYLFAVPYSEIFN